MNNQDVGDGLNRGGYRFNQEDITTRNYVGARFDYNASAAHQFEGTFTRLSDVDDRTDLDTIHDEAAGLHRRDHQVLRRRVALDGDRAPAERSARRRQPGAGGLRVDRGLR